MAPENDGRGMRALWVTAVSALLLTALAGCSDGGKDPVEDADFKDLDLKASSTKGLIRGVVVDDAVRPLAAAKVSVQSAAGPLEAITSEEGLFGFDELEPGTYFIFASKAGFKGTQTSTDVVAGVEEPPIVRVLLSPDASFVAPYVETFVFDGFIECSAGAAIDDGNYGVENACSESVGTVQPFTNSATFAEHQLAGTPMWVQSETVWSSTQAVSSSLSVNFAYPDDSELDGWKDLPVEGKSPLLNTMDEETAAEYIKNGTLNLRVFPWTDSYPGPIVSYQQRFTIFTHVFYGYQPPEGWRFTDESSVPAAP
jgi:hypothetical protein